MEQAGGTPELISTEVGKIQAFNHLTPADTFEADRSADSVTASDYAGLVLPGGVANPDFLRMNAAAVAFAKSFFDAGKPVAVICHGPWTLIEADVVRDRKITSWPSVKTDLVNAGADWVDDEVVNVRAAPTRWSPAASPTTCPPSATHWWERSRHESLLNGTPASGWGARGCLDSVKGGYRMPYHLLTHIVTYLAVLAWRVAAGAFPAHS